MPNPIGTAGHGIYPLLRRIWSLWGLSFVPAMVRVSVFNSNFLLLTKVSIPGGVPTKTVWTKHSDEDCV